MATYPQKLYTPLSTGLPTGIYTTGQGKSSALRAKLSHGPEPLALSLDSEAAASNNRMVFDDKNRPQIVLLAGIFGPLGSK